MAESSSDLHVLNSITIESPCPVPWDQIEGKGRVRSCRVCEKPVFDVIEMTTTEAAAILSDAEALPCVRLCRTPDGQVVTADHAPGVRGRIWRKLRRKASWAASLFAVLFLPGCARFVNSCFAYGLPARSIKTEALPDRDDAKSHAHPKPETTDVGADVPATR